MKIIGFDPGYGIAGWGVIEMPGNDLRGVVAHYGAITTKKTTAQHDRMNIILQESLQLLEEHRPACAVVEKLYFNKNIKTAGEVYQARGVLLAAISSFGCDLIELNPNKIKHMITGRGQADKREVELMVQRLLGIQTKITPDDAADALAGAIAGAFIVQSQNMIRSASVVLGRQAGAAMPARSPCSRET